MAAGLSTEVNNEIEATTVNVYSYRAAKYITPQLRCYNVDDSLRISLSEVFNLIIEH